MYSLNSLRCLQQSKRPFSHSSLAHAKSHYDSLGVTPKATQADIKGAYYKLSMQYHPDMNKDSQDAAQKFRDITEAYEVLGNVRLRKLYDKGVSHIGNSTPDDPTMKFYKSRERRTRPPSTGKTPIYDFDEWSRAHYGATFAKDMERKRKMQFNRNVRELEKEELQKARIFSTIILVFFIIVIFTYEERNVDKVSYISENAVITSAVRD